MQATLVPYNWRNVKAHYLPSIENLRAHGTRRKLTKQEVLLHIDPRADISELRTWLLDNARGRFSMFGCFTVCDRKWEVRCEYNGVVFSFTDIRDAVLFKLFWYDSEPIMHE